MLRALNYTPRWESDLGTPDYREKLPINYDCCSEPIQLWALVHGAVMVVCGTETVKNLQRYFFLLSLRPLHYDL